VHMLVAATMDNRYCGSWWRTAGRRRLDLATRSQCRPGRRHVPLGLHSGVTQASAGSWCAAPAELSLVTSHLPLSVINRSRNAGWVGVRSGTLVRRRQLARILRELRLSSGMTIETAAPLLDFSPAKLSRIENAHQAVDVHAVRTMMDIFGVVGERWEEILELTREASSKGWWRAYGLDDQGYVPLEAEASAVREYTVSVVPGLLQTADYARALFEDGPRRVTRAEQENDVAVRMIRQDRLRATDDPLELIAVIEEAALRRVTGGPDVMCAQLAHVLEAAELDTVTVQVLPMDMGSHPGLGGAFTILSFDGLGEPDIGYVGYPMGAVHIEKAEDVKRGRVVFDRLRARALGPAESAALIERVAMET
jgi:Domain of unknown function (DUF5753)/Helix-turn-helix domain